MGGFIPGPAGTSALVYTHGPAYYAAAAQVYLFVLAGCALVVPPALQNAGFRRRQAVTVLLASVVPLTAGVLYTINVALVPGLDLTPVSFAATGLIFLSGIGLFRVFDLASAARTALVEQTSDAVVDRGCPCAVADTSRSLCWSVGDSDGADVLG